jgi:hypothetical protein
LCCCKNCPILENKKRTTAGKIFLLSFSQEIKQSRTKQENRALKSTIDKMFNGQLALQSKANICGQIVREQSKIICGLEQNKRDTI